MKQLIPADTVDAAGNVWETTGENIRNGVREFSEKDVKLFVNAMFPVGSLYCGENSFILSVGKWELLKSGIGYVLALATNIPTGTISGSNYAVARQTARSDSIALRIWKRVS